MNIIDLLIILTTIISETLAIFEKPSNFIWGIINSLILMYAFLSNRLWADIIIQMVLILLCIYGFIKWKQSSNKIKISRLTNIEWILCLLAGILIFFLATHSPLSKNNSFPKLEMVSFAFFTVGIFTFCFKRIESWTFFIIADVIVIFMNWQLSSYSVVASYIIFIAMNLCGIKKWAKLEVLQKEDFKLSGHVV